jgi:hypothetical protein
MLKSISWHDLFHAVLIIFCLYYLVFLVVAYRNEIRALFTGKRSLQPPAEDRLPKVLQEMDVLARVLCKMLAHEIKTLIHQVKAGHADREHLLEGISDRLHEHKQLQDTAHGQALTTFIIQECARNNIKVSNDEIAACWGAAHPILPTSNNP